MRGDLIDLIILKCCCLTSQELSLSNETVSAIGVAFSGFPVAIPRYTRFVLDGSNRPQDPRVQQLVALVLQIVDLDRFQRYNFKRKEKQTIES